jgi:hypothetical protein
LPARRPDYLLGDPLQAPNNASWAPDCLLAAK